MSEICTEHKLDVASGVYYPWTQEDCPYCEIKSLQLWLKHYQDRTSIAERQLASARATIQMLRTTDGGEQLIINQARQEAARECLNIVATYLYTENMSAQIIEHFGLEG